MAATLRIDFVSDIVCPWCAIGLLSLLKALEPVRAEVAADLHIWPFELNPDMGPEGENLAEHTAKKYGSTPERSAAVRQAIESRGAELGFVFRYGPQSRIWNTFDAHRLLHWARSEGKELDLKQALFRSYFTDGRASSDPAALADAAQTAGLDPLRAREVIASGAFAAEVRAEEAQWRRNGINAVPSVIFDRRWLIQGGQPVEVFEQAMRDIVSGAARPAS